MSHPTLLRAEFIARRGDLALDVGLEASPGPIALVGPNGAGKSTLLALVLGLVRPERGRVLVGDVVLFDSERAVDVPVEHRRVGYVPQDYALFPQMNVRENVAFGVIAVSRDAREREARVARELERFSLGALAERKPASLSGGQRQRVALARALAAQPRALLLDEPLAALDLVARRAVREELAGYLDELGLPSVIVTHDPEDARRLASHVVVLEQGKVSQAGSWDELSAAPATEFVREFVGGPSPRARA